MKSKQINVCDDFIKLLDRERSKLAMKLKMNGSKDLLTNPLITQVIANKFKGNPSDIIVFKHKVVIK